MCEVAHPALLFSEQLGPLRVSAMLWQLLFEANARRYFLHSFHPIVRAEI